MAPRSKVLSRKISESLKLASCLMPSHSRPVIQSLQGQVDVFIRLEFHHCQSPFASDGQHINHGAIRSRKRRHLLIQARCIKPFVHCTHILNYQRFQPALRM